jgi:hypothetical protein
MIAPGTIIPLSEFILFYRAHKFSLKFRNVGINDLDWIVTQDMQTNRCNYRYLSEKFAQFIELQHMRDINEICKLFASSYANISDIFVKIEGYY